MSAYIATLKKQIEHSICLSAKSKRGTLQERLIVWFENLPPESRRRPFSMYEFENALLSQGRHISNVLLQLGWHRKRIWSNQRYCRYWLPPS